MNAAQVHKSVWKPGAGKCWRIPQGRQVENQWLPEVRGILGGQPRRLSLLIEFLHIIQVTLRCSSGVKFNPFDYETFR